MATAALVASVALFGRVALPGSAPAAKAGEEVEKVGRALPGGLPIRVTSSISPVVKLRKKVQAMGTTLSLSCAYHTVDRLATFETTWRDSFIGGELSVTDNLQAVQWRKMWLLPGLSDAATKIEVVSAFDLRTLRADARVRLGLRRRFSKAGISLAHLVNLDGPDGRAKLEVRVTASEAECFAHGAHLDRTPRTRRWARRCSCRTSSTSPHSSSSRRPSRA